MEKPNFNEKPPEETPSSEETLTTEELVAGIEADKELEEFVSGTKMAEDYEEIGIMEFLGDMTKKAMEDLSNDTEIRAEFIPEQLRDGSGVEYRVYKILKKYDPDSPEEQKIIQDEIKRQEEIQKKADEQYEALAEAEK